MKQTKLFVVILAVFILLTGCSEGSNVSGHEPITDELISILAENPALKELLITSIELAKEINPDKNTNPAQTLDEYYVYLDRSVKAMPWNVLNDAEYPAIFEQVDQSLDYFYFILDQPLTELFDKGYYYNSLQYVPELQPWIVNYCKAWGSYLSTEESWNDEYYELMRQEPRFNLDKGWYEDSSNWKTWNDFFARRLSSPAVRPIASPEDNSVVAAPADSEPQGVWRIDEDSYIVSEVLIKSTQFSSIAGLLGNSEYKDVFAGGVLTHTFLNVDDYHRFHFPVSGTVKEVNIIPAQDAAGGLTVWDASKGRYILYASEFGWQTIETRGCVIIETKEYGHVAVLPVGMSQISSVVFEESVKAGAEVKKGDMLGCFLFGGSDIVMLFEKQAGFEITAPQSGGGYSHLLMGQEYGRFHK